MYIYMERAGQKIFWDQAREKERDNNNRKIAWIDLIPPNNEISALDGQT